MNQTPQPSTTRGVIFDMDGTLIEPAIDFEAMRRAVGILDGDLLDTIESWGEGERAANAHAVIADFERQAAERMVLMPGTSELMAWLEESELERGIITRNNRDTLSLALTMLGASFSLTIDRTFLPPKPAPDSLLHVASQWGMAPDEVWMIGDSRHDLLAAQRAGMRCCLVAHSYNSTYQHQADAVVERLDELCDVLV